MNLSKSSSRGTSLEKCDPVNKVLFGQWNDNKVISFISTPGVSGLVTIQHHVGANLIDLMIEKALKCYTRDVAMKLSALKQASVVAFAKSIKPVDQCCRRML